MMLAPADGIALTRVCGLGDLELVAGLETAFSHPIPSRFDDRRIERVRQRIHDEPAAAFTLGQLAREAGQSRFQLHRSFVRESGLPPHAYILQQRLALARRLILRGEPVSHAAIAAGFSDQSHLTRWFAKVYGVPPVHYARNAR